MSPMEERGSKEDAVELVEWCVAFHEWSKRQGRAAEAGMSKRTIPAGGMLVRSTEYLRLVRCREKGCSWRVGKCRFRKQKSADAALEPGPSASTLSARSFLSIDDFLTTSTLLRSSQEAVRSIRYEAPG